MKYLLSNTKLASINIDIKCDAMFHMLILHTDLKQWIARQKAAAAASSSLRPSSKADRVAPSSQLRENFIKVEDTSK